MTVPTHPQSGHRGSDVPGYPPRDAADSPQLSDAARTLLSQFPLVNDHPDVAGLLRQPETLALLGPALAEHTRDMGVTVICAPEARGPILGALVALELGVGMVMVRKTHRNHPGADSTFEVGPTWRGHNETFQARSIDLKPTDRVLAVDDWVTTGSTLEAIRTYTESVGATYLGASVLVDKAERATLERLEVTALLKFAWIMAAANASEA